VDEDEEGTVVPTKEKEQEPAAVGKNDEDDAEKEECEGGPRPVSGCQAPPALWTGSFGASCLTRE